jgi:hypothetical protein
MVETVVGKTNPNIFMDRHPHARFIKVVRYGGDGTAMTSMFDTDAFRSKCLEHINTGLDRIPASHPDPLAVMMSFASQMLREQVKGTVSGRDAYNAYAAWARANQAEPMPRPTFTENLRTYIEINHADRISNERSPYDGDHYVGLALL